MAEHWPSLNYAFLMGKVVSVTRIQWEDGATTASINLCTKKRVADRITGAWRRGNDFHQVEISPGEPVFKTTWPGTIIQVRGELDVFPWQPYGAKKPFNVTVLVARGFQVIQESDKPREVPKTVLRAYKVAGADKRVTEGHTEFAEEGEEG